MTLDPKDLEVSAWQLRAANKYGRFVGVQVRHLPSGTVVQCCTERSQHANRNQAILELEQLLSPLKPMATSTYEEYRQLRRDCGYDEHAEMVEKVWNGCDAESQQNMLDQYRAGVAEVAAYKAAGWGTW